MPGAAARRAAHEGFISYNHKQSQWVWDRLKPCLEAGGAEVLIDGERFAAGKAVVGQMDAVQDDAERHVLVLSDDYLKSKYCCHEMDRAIDADPAFSKGTVIPVLLSDCKLPNRIKRPNPLYVDLRDDGNNQSWDVLLSACGVDLGVDAAHWLAVRDELRQDLELNRSVNLVVSGKDVAWRGLIDQLAADCRTKMTVVDLHSARTIERPGLLTCMLGGGAAHALPAVPRDLAAFQGVLESRPAPSRVALLHFDQAPHREYDADFFTTLRYAATEIRKLVLLIQSRVPFLSLLDDAAKSAMSAMVVDTVELRGRK